MDKVARCVIVLVFVISAISGCSKKQLIPAIIAGTGGTLVTAGAIYRVTLPEEDSQGLFGRHPEQKATTATLLFAGLALIVIGVIWSATASDCEADADCWNRDRCDSTSKTCVPRPLDTKIQTKNTQNSNPVVPAPWHIGRFRLNIPGAVHIL